MKDAQQNADNGIKSLLMAMHELYIEDTMNPFKVIGSPITSKRFDQRVDEHIQAFNNSDGMI
jgi:Sedlin, N-terminal conserved region